MHSASWVTLEELEGYDWQGRHTFIGHLDERQYEAWDHRSEPEEYSRIRPNPKMHVSRKDDGSIVCHFEQDADGNQIYDPYPFDLLSEEEYCALRDGGQLPDREFFVRVTWDKTNAECAGSFYATALPWLRTLGKPDAVRLVFAFDS
jgi:hypothetical protein